VHSALSESLQIENYTLQIDDWIASATKQFSMQNGHFAICNDPRLNGSRIATPPK
jgi:hypothetical protein